MFRTITGLARTQAPKSKTSHPSRQLRHFAAALRAPSNSSAPYIPDFFGMKDDAKRKATLARSAADPLVEKLAAKEPIRVAVTGPAGAIGYALLFRLLNGEMLGPDQPVIIHAIELPNAMDKLEGVKMEVEDCAFPLMKGFICTDNVEKGFDNVDIALLVGSKPRGPGMERSDLIMDNGVIFQKMGQALDQFAAKHCRVVVTGNPCNTNCMIAANNAPSLKIENFTAMTRLDHDRLVGLMASKTMLPANEINRVAVWGNHSATMFPDIAYTTAHGTPMHELIGNFRWNRYIQHEMTPKIQQRGAEIIKARGSSSAASAANATISHTRDWCLGTTQPDWVSMGVVSGGEYNVPPGLVFSYPCWCVEGAYEVATYPSVFGMWEQYMVEANIKELEMERDIVASLLPN